MVIPGRPIMPPGPPPPPPLPLPPPRQRITGIETGYLVPHLLRFRGRSALIGMHVLTPEDVRGGALERLGVTFRPLDAERNTIHVIVVEEEEETT